MEPYKYVLTLEESRRLIIPKDLRLKLNLNPKDPVEFFWGNDKLLIRKYVPIKQCNITGQINKSNLIINENIVLSLDGAKILLSEIKRYLSK